MNDWLQQKWEANVKTPGFRGTVKQITQDSLARHQFGVSNISEQLKATIMKWGCDKVEKEMGQICTSKADVIVAALKNQILPLIQNPSSTTESTGIPKAVAVALKVIQKQVTDLTEEATKQPVIWDDLVEYLIVMAVFENPKTAATKVLELVHVWVEFVPDRRVELENAAKNIINFQSTKGYLTLLDFDTAIIRILSDEARSAFNRIQESLKLAMGKPAHEIKMDASE